MIESMYGWMSSQPSACANSRSAISQAAIAISNESTPPPDG